MTDRVKPTHDLTLVRALAADETKCVIWQRVLPELRNYGLDTDDLRDIIIGDLGSQHCFKTAVTQKYHPGTVSDYFSIWVDECNEYMFIKLLISDSGELVITSFKKDTRHG